MVLMRSRAPAVAFSMCLLWILAPGAQPPTAQQSASRTLTPDDLARFVQIEDAQISPDATWVAYTVKSTDVKDDRVESRVWMVPVAGGEARPLTSVGMSSSHPRWSSDDNYLAFLSAREEKDSDDCDGCKKQLWLLSRQGGEPQQVTHTVQDVDAFEWSPESDHLVLVLRDPSPDELAEEAGPKPKRSKPHRPIVVDRLHFKEDEIGFLDRRRSHLYVFTLATGALTQITSGDYDDLDPAWSPGGRLLAFASNRTAEPDANFNSDIWTVTADNTDKGAHLTRITANQNKNSTPVWSSDGKWIAYTTQLDPKLFEYGTYHLGVAPAAGGGPEKILTRSLDRNVTLPHFSHDGKWIYFIADDDGTQQLLRVSPTAEKEKIERPIAGRQMVESFSLSDNGSVAAAISTISRPTEIYVLTAAGSIEPRRVTSANDAVLSDLRLGAVEYVRFKSKDGTAVSGYLYKPPEFTPGRRHPALLIPHGGPVWAHYADFDFLLHLFAAHGFVVLAPNPRGSTGYGEGFCKAIFANWGNKDLEDDLAMVDYAIDRGIADPEQLGVGGHSYGAMATNYIITRTTRFKGAVSKAGEFLIVSNWGHDMYSREFEFELGLPWENRALWEKLSMFNSVAKIKTPTLILSGDADWNVPLINSEQMYESLKRLGVPTLLVIYPGEAHEFARPSFLRDLYTRELLWFTHYVTGGGPAAPPNP